MYNSAEIEGLSEFRDKPAGTIRITTARQEVVKSMDTLKDAGFNPNSIALLPPWYNPAGH